MQALEPILIEIVEKKMVKYFLLFFVILVFCSCNVDQKISRRFDGEGRELLLREFGEPTKIIKLDNGNERFIYIKETYIRETEIGTGGFTMDPRISASFIKEETYRFEINQNGTIVDSSYEKKQK